MTKTPEQMAEEYSSWIDAGSSAYRGGVYEGFLVGYQAAKDETNLPTSAKWISVNRRLPEEDTNVLAYINYTIENEPVKRVTSGAFRGGLWLTDHEILAHPLVSHWMPLPKPPEAKE